jgi:hypothetical protein
VFIRIALSVVAVLALATAGRAQVLVLFSDGFESYAPGALDKNLSGGPNAAPNGSGNPWFGPNPPNLRVVGAEGSVTPHSGTQMVRGLNTGGGDFDQNWYNLAYRNNGGKPYTANIAMDWWFYDPLGAGGAGFQDYAALGFYNTAPGNTDYPGSGNLNTGATQVQRLSLGASSNQSTGFDPAVYQARVVGVTDGYGGATGWFNTEVARSVGWHHGRIVVGPAYGGGLNDVSFFIDDMGTPADVVTNVTSGYNVMEFNADFGAVTGYYDDLTFSQVPEPSSLVLSLGGFALLWRRVRVSGHRRARRVPDTVGESKRSAG